MAEDAPDVGQEAHVEHPVRFVEHEVLECIELCVGRAHVIEQPARRRDDHVDASAERVLLRTHPHPAVDGCPGERGVNGKRIEVFEDLRRELPRRREHQRARDAARPSNEAVKDRQQERRRLAAARLRAREQIASLQGGRNRLLLNRRRTNEPELADTLEQVRMKAQRGERHAATRPFSVSAPCRSPT